MRYDNIIDLPHPVLKNHYPMSLYNRAAQFAPFAALAGYGDACNEITQCNSYGRDSHSGRGIIQHQWKDI